MVCHLLFVLYVTGGHNRQRQRQQQPTRQHNELTRLEEIRGESSSSSSHTSHFLSQAPCLTNLCPYAMPRKNDKCLRAHHRAAAATATSSIVAASFRCGLAAAAVRPTASRSSHGRSGSSTPGRANQLEQQRDILCVWHTSKRRQQSQSAMSGGSKCARQQSWCFASLHRSSRQSTAQLGTDTWRAAAVIGVGMGLLLSSLIFPFPSMTALFSNMDGFLRPSFRASSRAPAGAYSASSTRNFVRIVSPFLDIANMIVTEEQQSSNRSSNSSTSFRNTNISLGG